MASEAGWPRFDAAGRLTRLWDTPPADTAYPLDDLYRLWPRNPPR
jgi:para-nitrobenzyl esterase